MAHFIDTNIGMINLDRVLRIERLLVTDEVRLHLDNGRSIDCSIEIALLQALESNAARN